MAHHPGAKYRPGGGGAAELSGDIWGLVLEHAGRAEELVLACTCRAARRAVRAAVRPRGATLCTPVVEMLHSVALLEWASELPRFPLRDARLTVAAARLGNLPVLQRLHELLGLEAATPEDVEVLGHAAAESGNLEVLQWVEQKYGLVWDEKLFAKSVAAGCLPALKWLREKGCPWSKRACAKAAESGNLQLLKWLRHQGCKWDEETCCKAAEHGHLCVLQYAVEHDCPWDKWTCAAAAWSGQLQTLQYARQQGCPWDNHTYYNASANKQTHIIEWLNEAGCPRDVAAAVGVH